MTYQINYNELVKKWEPLLNEEVDGMKSIKNRKMKAATAVMLENQYQHLKATGLVNEAGVSTGIQYSQSGQYATDGTFHKIAIPMIRRTFPELVAHDLVGVQPMAGPTGIAFALRFRASQATGNAGGYAAVNQEIGYNVIDPAYSGTMGTSAGMAYTTVPSATGYYMASATAASDNTLASWAAQLSAGEALGSTATGATSANPGIYNGLGVGTGQGIPEVSLTIEKQQVDARTRKLKSKWSMEVAQDLRAMHGLEIEKEMMDILAYEITAEIDREIMNNIRLAASYNIWSGSINWATSAIDGRWEAERYRSLFNKVIRDANKIAVMTRRGSGNFVVADPIVSAVLESTSSFTIAPIKADVNSSQTGVSKIGTLDGRFTLYRDTFANYSGTTPEYVVGFKGSSVFDAGIIYLPYVQLMFSKAVLEESFNPAIGVQTRYGLCSNIFGAGLYYVRQTISNFPLV